MNANSSPLEATSMHKSLFADDLIADDLAVLKWIDEGNPNVQDLDATHDPCPFGNGIYQHEALDLPLVPPNQVARHPLPSTQSEVKL